MRDPARIDPLLKKLGDYWKLHPDLRLGQILQNFMFDEAYYGPPDLFYVEDSVFDALLTEYFEEVND